MTRARDLSAVGHAASIGQCRFEYVSTSVCRLNRFNGKYLFINGRLEEIPSAGVDLANTALGSNDTTYYVYAYMNSGTMTLEASATAYATDSTHGHKIKSGDATRTLVGMVRKTSGNFIDTTQVRFVLSWFNRGTRAIYAFSAATVVNTSAVSFIAAYFLAWAGEGAIISCGLSSYNTVGPEAIVLYPSVDGSGATYSPVVVGVNAANAWYGGATSVGLQLTEGYHYANAYTAAATYTHASTYAHVSVHIG